MERFVFFSKPELQVSGWVDGRHQTLTFMAFNLELRYKKKLADAAAADCLPLPLGSLGVRACLKALAPTHG